MFARPLAPVGLAWFLHIVLVAGIAVGLYFAQPHLANHAEHHPRPTVVSRPLATGLFLLAYLLAWSAVWLWALLAPGQPSAEFPDLDTAWNEIVASLAKAGIGLADTPMFLVLATSPPGMDALFSRPAARACRVRRQRARQPDPRVRQPRRHLHRDSRRELARYPGLDRDSDDENLPFADSMGQSMGVGASIGIDQSVGISMGGSMIGSVGIGAPLHEIQRIVRRAREENRPLTDAEKKQIRDLSGKPAPAAPPPTPGSGGCIGFDPPELATRR